MSAPASLDARAPDVYFKATQMDGRSFQGSPKVLYEVGATVVPAPQSTASGAPRICGPGYLHASDAEGETLIGGSWPCRLFEVTGTPVAGFDGGEHRHKGGFLSLTVVREIEAHRALGPNGAQVAAFIERLKTATKDDWTVVIRERQRPSRDAARDAARAAAWDAATDAARDAAWAAATAAWAAARDAATAARAAARDAATAARDAARDAALALLARDKLSPEQFDLLYKPLASIIPADSLLAETQPEVTK